VSESALYYILTDGAALRARHFDMTSTTSPLCVYVAGCFQRCVCFGCCAVPVFCCSWATEWIDGWLGGLMGFCANTHTQRPTHAHRCTSLSVPTHPTPDGLDRHDAALALAVALPFSLRVWCFSFFMCVTFPFSAALACLPVVPLLWVHAVYVCVRVCVRVTRFVVISGWMDGVRRFAAHVVFLLFV